MAVSIPTPRTAIAEELTKEEAAKIEELIEELASSNDPKLLIPSGISLKTPPEWDHKAQARVSKAATSLVEKGPSAFPQLIAHARDKRFSFVNKSINDAMSKESVGKACERIIEVQVDVFEQIGIYPGLYPSYFWSVVLGDPDLNGEAEASLENWWKKRKDKSLVELQIESVEWAIQTELLGKWRNDKLHKDDLKGLRSILAENRKTLRKLESTKQPIEREVHPFKIYESK